MPYDATVRSLGRYGLTEEQDQMLRRLEQVAAPTEWQRGELAALRMCGITDTERVRIAAVTEKWGTS